MEYTVNEDKLAAGNVATRSDRFSVLSAKTGHCDGVPSPFPAAMKTHSSSPFVEYISRSEAETEIFAANLAAKLRPGDVVALVGTLGAGKTRLVRAIAEAMGVPPGVVTSPTFVLMHQYEAANECVLYHLDTYRLKDVSDFERLGTDELFDSGGIVFVEWADRVETALPPHRIEIHIEIIDDTTRQFLLGDSYGFTHLFGLCLAAGANTNGRSGIRYEKDT